MPTGCRRVRDYAQIKADGVITKEVANSALTLEIDKMGLDKIDKRVMLSIIDSFGGGPVGLIPFAAMIGEDALTIEDVYEPYLIAWFSKQNPQRTHGYKSRI